jgi:hypothetical protein
MISRSLKSVRSEQMELPESTACDIRQERKVGTKGESKN